jgi:threonine aldolase
MIDLRSDTVTQPTPGMRRAIAEAAVGDEQKREDPTVLELQRRVAELLGQEAAVFVPTATMANQIALKLHGRPGDVLLAEEHSHVVIYEYGGPAAHAGLLTHGLRGEGGRLSANQIRAAAAPSSKVADQRATVLSLENTHNSAGGRVWPLDELEEVVSVARETGLAVHLDGALLAGSAELMERAWREKHLFGGAMRQSGIVAAAGVYALDHHVERLGEDHARARSLAEGLAAGGLPVDAKRVETNFVQIDLAPLGLERADALARLLDAGVGLSTTIHPTVLRAVTHLDITDEDVERAVELIPSALGIGVAAPS